MTICAVLSSMFAVSLSALAQSALIMSWVFGLRGRCVLMCWGYGEDGVVRVYCNI
ncbi:hypothetical protein BDW42DRAFT_158179 [Aspergillus taichungensis]|uniref:Uncharacterized protein n=1 Tax=Aspergillus taichungensis TaxID=482145 RepID=A0A2J5I9C2_9EURO|nr:hypothetical protein BDW42DRAFT_158179 [Aspergillus taichungensis]